MAVFTPTQGRYLAYIHAYTALHGFPPAESEVATAICVSPPSVNQMVKTLEKKGLLLRRPGQPRSLQILVPADQIPDWNGRKSNASLVALKPTASREPVVTEPKLQANLYILDVYLAGGPIGKKLAKKEISRTIEIRGDQTLAQLHAAIFQAYDRWDEQLYEFQFGKRPFDPAGPNFGIGDGGSGKKRPGDARTTKLDELELKTDRVFGYWFDFGDDWYHQIRVERIEQAIPTVKYPRIRKRFGKSPPQYPDE